MFDPVRERIRTAKGKTRAMGADYLAYTLMDAIVDHYYVVLETDRRAYRIHRGAACASTRPMRSSKDIHSLKNELLFLRRTIWPLRDVIGFLERARDRPDRRRHHHLLQGCL
ncbi:MAG: hypothetical protein MZV70_57295 [Desulfobacterales bacterium]|nr:hypothetical protein [Desulfobacterales bacterium]